jgi:hypothetical protein
MTKILISNFPQSAQLVGAVNDAGEKVEFHVGYEDVEKSKEVLTSAMSSFFISLLVHDEIYITISDFHAIIAAIGPAAAISLLERKILKFVPPLPESVIVKAGPTSSTMSFNSVGLAEDAMVRFERLINSSKTIKASEKPALVQYVDNAKIEKQTEVEKLWTKELANDLEKQTFKQLGITTESLNNVNAADTFKLIRISEITKQLILQNRLNIDSISQDGFVQQYLGHKMGALTPVSAKDSLWSFKKISELKGIPDLYDLFKRGTITIDNILDCRDKYSGGLFRKWYSSTDYDEQNVLMALVNTSVKEAPWIKAARVIYPNVIGLMGPLPGLVASAVDSYIVGKILAGWNPSLFLDDVYKSKIDQCIARKEVSDRRAQIMQRYGKVDRNSPCPCQSGKKFKRCHGAPYAE